MYVLGVFVVHENEDFNEWFARNIFNVDEQMVRLNLVFVAFLKICHTVKLWSVVERLDNFPQAYLLWVKDDERWSGIAHFASNIQNCDRSEDFTLHLVIFLVYGPYGSSLPFLRCLISLQYHPCRTDVVIYSAGLILNAYVLSIVQVFVEVLSSSELQFENEIE